MNKEVTLVTIFIGFALGCTYGWIYHYDLPTPIIGLIVYGILGGLGGWAFKGDENGTVIFGVIAAVVLSIFGSLVERDIRAASLWAYLGFFGGIAMALHFSLAILGFGLGLMVGIIDVFLSPPDGGASGALFLVFKTSVWFTIILPLFWSKFSS